MLQQWRTYLLRPVHLLGYLLDPRYVDDTSYPMDEEDEGDIELILELARSHDVRTGMRASCTVIESELPPGFVTPTRDGISADYDRFRSKMGGPLALDAVWQPSAGANSLAWWKPWG